MYWTDLTFEDPAHNLLYEEALLAFAETNPGWEALRLWSPSKPFVVLGYATDPKEVHWHACHRLGIRVVRRCSGGGAVLQGPGCLNFALILSISRDPSLTTIDGTNAYILKRHKFLLESLLGRPIGIQGETDLTLDNRKVSGNAQRRKRTALLFHGTFLLNPDIGLMEQLLPIPNRQPSYRQNRSHSAFLTSLPLEADRLKEGLRKLWQADRPLKTALFYNILRRLRQESIDAEWRQIQRDTALGNEIGNPSTGQWGQDDAAAKMASGNQKIPDGGTSQDGKMIRGIGSQTGPSRIGKERLQ